MWEKVVLAKREIFSQIVKKFICWVKNLKS